MIRKFRGMLVRLAYETTLQEDHGQVFGLRRRLSEYEQVHVKVMPDGAIEAEIEPPPEYPAAHINQKHSYSPHRYIRKTLCRMGIPFSVVRDVPATCLRPVIVRPKSPTGWKTFVVIGAVVTVGASAFAYFWAKRKS